MTAYLALKEATVTDVNGDSCVHSVGTVLSEWEVNNFVKKKIDEASIHYASILEKLTDEEAFERRAKETAVEGDHVVDGSSVSPPWEDYVGLHPEDIVQRLHDTKDKDLIARVKLYEKGGQNRAHIVEYMAPAERPPFLGYDDMTVQQVWEKLAILPQSVIDEVKTYEFANRKRVAILTYEPDSETSDDGEGESDPSTQQTQEAMA